MKTKTKKILSTLLALMLIISAVPFVGLNASAETVKENGFWYSTYNGGAYIFNYDGDSEELIIPDTLGGCPIVNIDESAFSACSKIKSVSIPATVTEIEKEAFHYLVNLETVTFRGESQLKTIGDCAFDDCIKLTSVTIPASVTEIGFGAFSGCSSLTAINVEAGNTKYVSDNGILFNKDKTKLILYPSKKVGTSYTVPASVKTLETYAFSMNPYLNAITFEQNSCIEDMGDYIFGNCTALKTVTIPKGVTNIGLIPFAGCSSLESINVESGNTKYFSVDGVLMSKDKNGTSIIRYPEAKKASSYTIPAAVTNIEYGAFLACSTLVTLNYEENSQLKTIGKEAFESCSALTSVSFPKSVTEFIGGTFMFCRALKTVSFEEGSQFDTIGAYMFYECKALEKITVPSNVKNIGGYAFGSCSKLTSVTFKKDNSLESISNYAFYDHNEKLIIYGYTGSYEEDYADRNNIYFIALDAVHEHSYKLQNEVKPTCTSKGAKAYSCYCGHSYVEEVAATGHNYVNGICQNCGDDATAKCSCNCHKSGFSGFFWKIQLIIYKLFRMNDTCSCGVAHY